MVEVPSNVILQSVVFFDVSKLFLPLILALSTSFPLPHLPHFPPSSFPLYVKETDDMG